jgi:hypothetical protein
MLFRGKKKTRENQMLKKRLENGGLEKRVTIKGEKQ